MHGKTLYLGLSPPKTLKNFVHYPVIEIIPLSFDHPSFQKLAANWHTYTHILFTSQQTVKILAKFCRKNQLSFNEKQGIALGQATAEKMRQKNIPVETIASKEQAEGVIELLKTLDLSQAKILFPHSSLARPVITNYLKKSLLSHDAFAIYNTISKQPSPPPMLEQFEKIIFTSPSTVKNFFAIYNTLPPQYYSRVYWPYHQRGPE